MPVLCDWRGTSTCSRCADVELVYPAGSPNHDRRRAVCHRHAEVILEYCARARMDAPTPRLLHRSAVMISAPLRVLSA
ncbi:MAG TPA: hypothetical protein DCX12_10955 [Chloroflexi bacterium]|nr:hypothetical protein [Chloroflexota bacterium]HBV94207.1 hypothetical protein [Chloroflexota bacterium]